MERNREKAGRSRKRCSDRPGRKHEKADYSACMAETQTCKEANMMVGRQPYPPECHQGNHHPARSQTVLTPFAPFLSVSNHVAFLKSPLLRNHFPLDNHHRGTEVKDSDLFRSYFVYSNAYLGSYFGITALTCSLTHNELLLFYANLMQILVRNGAVRANTPLTVLVTALAQRMFQGLRVSDVGAQFTTTISTTLTYSGLLYLRTAATNVTIDVSPEPVILQIQDNGNDLEEEGGDDNFVDIDNMLLDELDLEELDLSRLLRRLLRQSLRQLPQWPLQRTGLLLQRLRLQLRPNHESEAARRAQRTKSSGRGGRRLLVVVILRPLAAKKASMPTVHSFKGL
ncbi:hypothetical protein V8E54_008809 [Elaphomyces granulatus]